ncbi:hypothetical protein DM860_013025 [Cuscuta australis]|uniref:Uncharacterized protein n=1 Tax=Cuscuta australis TaxID=267555 RepID=A0A328D364_9ASTE|nr:hypothetical protein DM860_013025 [Cuscuta australis]
MRQKIPIQGLLVFWHTWHCGNFCCFNRRCQERSDVHHYSHRSPGIARILPGQNRVTASLSSGRQCQTSRVFLHFFPSIHNQPSTCSRARVANLAVFSDLHLCYRSSYELSDLIFEIWTNSTPTSSSFSACLTLNFKAYGFWFVSYGLHISAASIEDVRRGQMCIPTLIAHREAFDPSWTINAKLHPSDEARTGAIIDMRARVSNPSHRLRNLTMFPGIARILPGQNRVTASLSSDRQCQTSRVFLHFFPSIHNQPSTCSRARVANLAVFFDLHLCYRSSYELSDLIFEIWTNSTPTSSSSSGL